jgi:hypothetical protein
LRFAGVATGAAVALRSPLALLGPSLLALSLDGVQMPAEEQALRMRFGASNEAYVRTVRRWLGRHEGASLGAESSDSDDRLRHELNRNPPVRASLPQLRA